MTKQSQAFTGASSAAGKDYFCPTPIGHEAAVLVAGSDTTANSPRTCGYDASDRDRQLAEIERYKRSRELRRRWQAAGVPTRHAARAKDLREAASGPWVEEYRRLRNKVADGSIVALLGQRGTGKTQMSVCLIRDAVEAGLTALYIRASDLFRQLRSTFRPDADETERALLQRFSSVGFLVIDEAHEGGGTDFEARTLTDIVDSRYGRMLSTLLLCNLTPEAFAQAAGPSIVSRMHECGGAIVCDWPSFRTPNNTPSRAPSPKQENQQVTEEAAVAGSDRRSPRPPPARGGTLLQRKS
jgi:DNA replication protein DnaC